MDILAPMALGIVQGLTEFLPISSTGHLILARALFDIHSTQALAFDAILHLATAGAVIVYFWNDIYLLLQTLLRKLTRLPVNEKEEVLLYALMVATVPAIIFGLLLESFMESVFRSPLLVAGVLIAGSILFIVAESVYMRVPRKPTLTITKGLIIGLFQCLALIPGMSRSGASIVGGMFLGLTRHEAARFSFLLAIPIILGAGAKKLLELATSDAAVSWVSVGLGATVAFVTGLLAIHFMLSFVRNHTLWVFIWYRLALAGFVIFVVVFG